MKLLILVEAIRSFRLMAMKGCRLCANVAINMATSPPLFSPFKKRLGARRRKEENEGGLGVGFGGLLEGRVIRP